MGDLETTLADWSIGSLLGLWFQSVFVGLCSHILTIAILPCDLRKNDRGVFDRVRGADPVCHDGQPGMGPYGAELLEVPAGAGLSGFSYYGLRRHLCGTGAEYRRGDDIAVAIWECMGYTVLLCYTLFKTGSLAKSLFRAH